MPTCMAYGCNNSVADYKRGISFHTLPLNNPDLLKKWLAKLRLENPPIRKSSRLCSEHFEKDCFERDLRAELMPDVKRRRILKPDAVPTIFAHVKAVKERPTSTRRLKKREDSDVGECHNFLEMIIVSCHINDSILHCSWLKKS